jgi:pseudo-rSAM protein
MNSGNSTFWFTLSRHTYVSFNSNSPLLLYNTNNGKALDVDCPKCIEVVHKVYEPSNLGVIEIDTGQLDDQVWDFIEKSVTLNIGLIMDKTIKVSKPINLLPILNLQNDVEKLNSNGETHFIGNHISGYLTSLTLYITNHCNQNCENCGEYFKQAHFCTKELNGSFLPLETIKELFHQSAPTQIKKVNIIGGNVALYPKRKELLSILNKNAFDYHFWFHLFNIDGIDLDVFPGQKEILVAYPFEEESLKKVLEKYSVRQDITFNFLIENDESFLRVNELLNQYDKINFELIPFFNGENIDFITQNVFLDEPDILSEIIEMRKIFRNQKLNSNFFGSFYVFPDGSVKANPNTPEIGKFPDNSLLELIYKELTSNTAWRRVRGEGNCISCMYRFLCPPPGNLESILKRDDLCHVDVKVTHKFQEI